MNNLAKITKLLSRGEKIIVVNEQADPQFVVMNMGEYEKIINNFDIDIKGLTEEELLAKINRDIAIWKSTQEVNETDAGSDNFIQNIGGIEDFKDKTPVDEEEDDKYYFEPVGEEEDKN
ncbi:MAG: hypothetical protein V1688_01675 [bacterium]